MASNRNIVTQQDVELIPSSQLPGFRESVATMAKLTQDLAPLQDEARKLAPILQKCDLSDRASRQRAAEIIAAIKRIDGDGEDEMKPHKKVINSVRDYILQQCRRVTNRVEEIKGPLSAAMGEWDRAEERAAQAERDRIAREKQAVLDREAEEKRRLDEEAASELRKKRVAEIRADLKDGKITKRQAEKLLKEAGALEESLKAKAAADEEDAKRDNKMEAATVEVKPNIPTVAGNVRRVNWSAECTDVSGFLSEYVRCSVTAPEKAARMREMIEVSNKSLSAAARAHIKTWAGDDNPRHNLTKEQFEALYPCVKAVEDRSY
jgi:hypothetical protein